MGELPKLQDVKAAQQEIDTLLSEEPAGETKQQGESVPATGDGLFFSDISFSYPASEQAAKPILQHAAFGLPQSGVCFLTGENGAGKSTLFQLVSGLRQLDSGTVYDCGRQIDRAALQQAVSYVS